MKSKIIGNIGESMAVNYLQRQGYKILATNFLCSLGEIDIIASKGDVIHFVEVKNRTQKFYGAGREAVDFRKQQTIRRVATLWLKLHKKLDSPCSCDVLEIDAGEINFLENSF